MLSNICRFVIIAIAKIYCGFKIVCCNNFSPITKIRKVPDIPDSCFDVKLCMGLVLMTKAQIGKLINSTKECVNYSVFNQFQDLVERGFVRKRKQNEGRSYWLELTDKFHQYFEVDNLREQGILEATDRE